MDYSPPAAWVASLVGRPALLAPDVTSFFVLERRPEPQSSWLLFFPYLAALLSSFLGNRRRLYVGVCVATPILTVLYVNVAVVALLVFVQLSLCNLVLYRRQTIVPFVLALGATLLAGVAIYLSGSTAAIAAQAAMLAIASGCREQQGRRRQRRYVDRQGAPRAGLQPARTNVGISPSDSSIVRSSAAR